MEAILYPGATPPALLELPGATQPLAVVEAEPGPDRPRSALRTGWGHDGRVITTRERVPRADFEAATGWELKPEGACRGELCVPLPGTVVDQGEVDLIAVAEHLRMPIVRDRARGVLALGPAVLTGRQLETAVAPELVLPDVEGRDFSLSSLRGQKVLLVAWAPY